MSKFNDNDSAEGTEVVVPVRKPSKGIYMLPNMITLAALFAGFYAIVMAINGRFDLATVGIFSAMVLDSLDGRVARMTNTQSAFGEQMDSLSDMVSFGAAPALIAYVWTLQELGRWGWIAAFVYCACAALRLARFNARIDLPDEPRKQAGFLTGVPAPVGAGLAFLPIYLWVITGSELFASPLLVSGWLGAITSTSTGIRIQRGGSCGVFSIRSGPGPKKVSCTKRRL